MFFIYFLGKNNKSVKKLLQAEVITNFDEWRMYMAW